MTALDSPLAERHAAAALSVPDGLALVVVGSQAWNPADRSLGRDAIRSLHTIDPERRHHCAGFDPLGANGVRDLLELPADADGPRLLLSTGYELLVCHLVRRTLDPIPLDQVSDLHELALEGDRILVANTKHDELIELSLDGTVLGRECLDRFRHRRGQPIDHARRLGGAAGPAAETADHFHLNQGFLDHDGHRCVLVHHGSGFRPFADVRHRLTGHGTGAVIDLDTGEIHELGLRAPHTVRRLGDGFLVLDSGRAEMVVLDRHWRELRRVPTPGWGRGAAVTPDGGVVYVALSSTRRRYLEGNDAAAGLNQVVAIRTDSWEVGEPVPIPAVEQLWSLRLVERQVSDAMARFTIP